MKLLSFWLQEGFEHSPITSTTSKIFEWSSVVLRETKALKSVLGFEGIAK